MSGSTLFLLHTVGLSSRSWDGVVRALSRDVECVALDLPGSAARAGSSGVTLEETAAWVAAEIRRREPDRWLIAGHGSGALVAAIVAAWAERGEHGLPPAAGLAVVGIPFSGPAPLGEDRRSALRRRWADGSIEPADAEAVLDEVAVAPIPDGVRAAAVEDLLGADRVAVLEWLDRGSVEDREDEIALLRTPATVVVGAQDPDRASPRGPSPVPAAPVHEVEGAGGLLPLEAPDEVAARIAALIDEVRDAPALPAAFARLLASDRVAARTRRVMLARLAEPDDAPRTLTAPQRELLGAVLARVVPQRGTSIDLAARIDAALAAGAGDGWRYAELPPDAEAYRRGLDTLAALEPGFADLEPAAQDLVLDRLAAGAVGSEQEALLTGPRMALWFTDVRADAVRTWLSHPAAQAWIRYDGFADGGDGPRKQGFSTTHAGEWEPWQRDWRTGKELQA